MRRRSPPLGHFEYTVITALAAHPEANYGTALANVLSLSQSAVATALSRMEAKGLVQSSWTEPNPVLGGRRRRVYRVGHAGELAMQITRDHYRKD